jgi:hypothetical protein
MNIDKRSILLLALATSTAVGAALAMRMRRRHVRAELDGQQKSRLKSWENEGGNLAPAPAFAIQPAASPTGQI